MLKNKAEPENFYKLIRLFFIFIKMNSQSSFNINSLIYSELRSITFDGLNKSRKKFTKKTYLYLS